MASVSTKCSISSLPDPLPLRPLTSLAEIKSLVCNRCWEDVFNTLDYQHVCMAEKDNNLSHSVTLQQVIKSSENGCSWCSFCVRELDIDGSRYTGYSAGPPSLSFELSSFHQDRSTPPGINHFLFHSRFSHSKYPWSMPLAAFTPSDDEASHFVTARPFQTNVVPSSTGEQMAKWLLECTEHSCCPPQTDTPLPSRVIELRPSCEPDTPRIIQTEGYEGRYATLSYCWGETASCFLLTSNIARYSQCLDMTALPQSIQDAISVAEMLPVSYLWIDALCILQDSEEDKAREIAKMEEVYKNSLVTIVASCSTDVSCGFLHDRKDTTKAYRVPYRIEEGIFGTMSLDFVSRYTYHEKQEPINWRAWTLQEQMLAPRCLNYAKHTLQWRCRKETKNLGGSMHCEDEDDVKRSYSLSTLSQPVTTPRDALIQWAKIVKIYTAREASLASDKLPALAGIAKNVSPLLGPGYYAGLWQYCLPYQLAWESQCRKDVKVRNNCAPTWAWASINGPATLPFYWRLDECEPCAEVLSIKTTLRHNHSLYGEVTNGRLRLNGTLRQGWVIKSKGDEYIAWCTDNNNTLATAKKMRTRGWRGAMGQFDTFNYETPMLVFGLPLIVQEFRKSPAANYTRGILLVPAENGNFERVGSFRDYELKAFDFSHQQEIVII